MHGDSLSSNLIDALQSLNLDVGVVGASFRSRLPPIEGLSLGKRLQVLAAERRRCRNDLLDDLMRGIGKPLHVRGHGNWGSVAPDDHACSITHKGTVVLIAHAPIRVFPLLGIDLENAYDAVGITREELAPEGLPQFLPEDRGKLLTFAAKESIFKAYYGQSRQPVEFSDVAVYWKLGSPILEAKVADDRFDVRARFVDDWVVTMTYATAAGSPEGAFTHL